MTNDQKLDPLRIPICWKCANRLIQPDLLDNREELVGCKKLGVKKWKQGWHDDDGKGILHQHNCPLINNKALLLIDAIERVGIK